MILPGPTQFEVPLFKYIEQVAPGEMRVLYFDPRRTSLTYDPELQRNVEWGGDMLGGYLVEVAPTWGRVAWLIRNVLRSEYDLVIINGYSRVEYIAAAAAALIRGKRRALRVDSVGFTRRSASVERLKKLLAYLIRSVFNHVFVVGTVSSAYCESLGLRDSSLFPYPVDRECFGATRDEHNARRADIRLRYAIPQGAFVVLSVAKHVPRESPWDILDAAKLVRCKGVHYLFVGDGLEHADLRREARERKLNATFAGYVPYRELPAFYSASDLYVHCSTNEPWGVSVGEALSAGIPVVASKGVGSASDLIVQGANGFVYEPGNSAAVADAISEVCAGSFRFNTEVNEARLSQWDVRATWERVRSATAKVVDA